MALIISLVSLGGVVAALLITNTRLNESQKTLSTLTSQVRRLESQNRTLSAENTKLKETSNTLHEIKSRVFEINRRRGRLMKWAALPDRGGNWIERIDNYLAGTPLRSQGRTFYLAAVDAGIEPRLMPSIAMIESGGGRVNANTNNYFGRRAVKGWASWPTSQAAIDNQANYIVRMWGRVASPYEMKGYAVPGGSWMAKVSSQMRRI